MKPSTLPKNETDRLAALKTFKISDVYPEHFFDDFTQLAAQICETPISLITLIDESHQCYKSIVGLDILELPQDISFCEYTILQAEIFEVPDASLDQRFQNNPLVTGLPLILFYAGMPLICDEGYCIGTLCVIDHTARQLTHKQHSALTALGRQVVSKIQSHLMLSKMSRLNEQHAQQSSFYNALLCSTNEIIISTNKLGVIQTFSLGAEVMLGYTASELVGKNTPLILHDKKEITHQAIELGLTSGQTNELGFNVLVINVNNGQSQTQEWTYFHKNGARISVNVTTIAMQNNAGELVGYLNIARDITLYKEAQQMLASKTELLEHTAEIAKIGGWELDLETMQVSWTKEVFIIHELDMASSPTVEQAISFYAPDAQPIIQSAVALGIETGAAWDLELPFITAKGRDIWVRAQGSVVMKEGKAVTLKGVLQDITERKKSELDLAWLNRAILMLSKSNEVLIHMTDERNLIVEICRIAVDVGRYCMAWVGYAEDDEHQSVIPKAHYGHNVDFLNTIDLSWSESKINGRGPAGRTIRNGAAVVVDDVMLDPSYPVKEQAAKAGYHALISLPLKSKGRTFGLLAMYSIEAHSFAQDEVRLLEELADNLAAGIVSIRREKERAQLHTAMLNLATAVSLTGGGAFFSKLLISMMSALGAQAGYVAQFLFEKPLKIRTVAAQVEQETISNYDYIVSEVLAEYMHSDNDLYIITENAARDYPNISMMNFYKYQAFAALRLHDSFDKPIGIIFVFFKEAINKQSVDLVTAMLKIFAARISSELERLTSFNLIQEQASLLDKTSDAIIVRDIKHTITFWNKGAEALYGWSAEEALGRLSYDLLEHDAVLFSEAVNVLLKQGEWIGEIAKRHKNGDSLIIETHWTLMKDKLGKPTSIFAIETNISARKIAEEEIRQLAFYDPLTNLTNRRLLINRLEQAIVIAKRKKNHGAVFFIDLDNFKTLNDTMGHDKGDLLLQEVAKRLTACVRAADTVARFGGDEFVVMVEDLSTTQSIAMQQASVVGEKILKTLNQSYDFDGYQHVSTPSIGAALFNFQTKGTEELLKQADVAMYQSKAAGRNTLSFL